MEQEQSGLINGFWYYFDIDGQKITINASIWSGRERIWIDDVEVVNVISFRFRTTHQVELASGPLTIQLGYGWNGALFASLCRGDTEIARQEQGTMLTAVLVVAFLLGVATAIVLA